MDANLYNGLTLAYIGDAIYEVYVRKYALSLGLTKVNNLHKKVIEFTKGEAQAKAIKELIASGVLTEEEIAIYKRGRNSHINSNRKNIDLANYLDGTGFEALIGYLYLKDNITRLEEIIDIVFNSI